MDRSLLYGDGLFETVRVDAGRAHRLDRHVSRLVESARELGFSEDSIEAGVGALHGLSDVDSDGLWRVTVSRSAVEAPFGGEGGVTTTHRQLPDVNRPALVVLRGWYVPDDPLGHHKSTSYQRWVEARRRANLVGADDAVMVSLDGLVGETSTSNLFVRIGSELATPPVRGLLPGVTRAAILEHGSELDYEIRERPVTLTDLERADEVICTSAGVLAVSALSVDGRVTEEALGPKLREQLRQGWP